MLLALVVLPVMAGCSGIGSSKAGGTAKQSLSVAESAVSTMAPEAKLLYVETAGNVLPNSMPTWTYIFGSPKTNKSYTTIVQGNTVTTTHETGDVTIDSDEWSSVPNLGDAKIDSDEAYDKALKASGVDLAPSGYSMLLVPYVTRSAGETVTTEPMKWYVTIQFDNDGKPMSVLSEVDAETGQAKKLGSSEDK